MTTIAVVVLKSGRVERKKLIIRNWRVMMGVGAGIDN
jgi:hypothetical protein